MWPNAHKAPGLLVSVRSPEEALAALEGGAGVLTSRNQIMVPWAGRLMKLFLP